MPDLPESLINDHFIKEFEIKISLNTDCVIVLWVLY